jgi:hypothetical protein
MHWFPMGSVMIGMLMVVWREVAVTRSGVIGDVDESTGQPDGCFLSFFFYWSCFLSIVCQLCFGGQIDPGGTMSLGVCNVNF